MSADYLTVKANKEKIEDENFTLREELTKMRRSAQLKEALAADAGIEFSQPEEIANRFRKWWSSNELSINRTIVTLREKHRRTQNENAELKAKLRLYEADLIQNDSKQTGRSRDLEKLRDKFEKQESAIEGLSKKVIKVFYILSLTLMILAQRSKEARRLVSRAGENHFKTGRSIFKNQNQHRQQ